MLIDKNRFIKSVFFLMVVLMTTSTYFQIGSLPIFMFLWIVLFSYILMRKKTNNNDTSDIIQTNKRRTIFTILALWLMYAMIQYLLLGYNWAGTRYFILIFINVTTFIMIISYAKDINIIKLLNKGILFGLTINLTVAFWEINTSSHIKALTLDYERRFESTPLTFFSNPNDFASFLFCSVVILMFELVMSNNKKYRFLLYILLGATIYIIFETNSRGGINGILIFFSLYIILRIIGKISKGEKNMFGILSLLIFILSIGMLILLIVDNYFFSIFSTYNEYIDDRLYLWEQSFELFINSFLLGIGPGQALIKMGGNVHFLFLEILTEYGVFVVAGLAVVFFKLVKMIYPFINSKINALITSFIIVFLPVSISSSSMTKIYAIWVIFGIIYALKINDCDKNLNT